MPWDTPIGYSSHYQFPKYSLGANPGADALNENLIEAIDAAIFQNAGVQLLSANNNWDGVNTFDQTIIGSISGNSGTVTIDLDDDSNSDSSFRILFSSTAIGPGQLKVGGDAFFNPFTGRLLLQNLTVANVISGSISGNAATVTNGLYSTGSYSNPSWLTSLAWSKLSSKPTTLAGYGITDGLSTSRTLTINSISYDLSADRSWNVGDLLSSGSYNNPSWLTGLAWSKISSKPTTLSGYGITDGVIWRGESISDPASPSGGSVYYNSVNDAFKIYSEGEGNWTTMLLAERSYSNPSWLASLAESKVLPSQSGYSGKALLTNGNSSYWGDISFATNATNSINAVKVQTDLDSDTNSNLYVPFTSTANSYASLKVESGLVYNPYTERLTVPNITVTNTITGSVTGNAGSVTNGIYLTNVYYNPSWIGELAWSKITMRPTSLAGYGITDAVSTSGIYSNPNWLSSLDWSKITSVPNADANGTTKGVATFNADDFNASSGVISIDWANTYSGYLSGITSNLQSQLNEKVSASANNAFSGNNQFSGDIKISDDFVREPKSVTPQVLSGSDYYIDCRGKNDVEIDAAGDRTIINISEEGVIDGTYLTIFNMSSSYDLIFERGDNLVLPEISITLGNKYDNITFRYEQTGNYWICVSYIIGNAI